MSEQRSSRHLGTQALAGMALALGLTALAACETGPIYAPRGPNGVVGYTDQQLTPNRYRVTFTGSTGTKREDVEDYLLRRAAEVTLQAGFTHFKFDARDTREQTYYRTDFGPGPGFGYGAGFGPRFGYRPGFPPPGFGPGFRPGIGPAFGPRPWYWSSFPFRDSWYDGEVIPVTRYTAYSEIVMLNADEAAHDPAAIAARDILDRLVPAPGSPPP